jgi:protein-tyrosine phosphatase
MYASRALGTAATDVEIASAGLDTPVGREMDPRSAAALIRLGGDPAGAYATALIAGMAEDADLVFTMTRSQRRAVLEQTPRGLRRTFTLLEAADLLQRADSHGLESRPLAQRAGDLADLLHAGRARRRSTNADDIADPVGQPEAVHDRVASVIDGALRPLAAVLFVSSQSAAAAASVARLDGRD